MTRPGRSNAGPGEGAREAARACRRGAHPAGPCRGGREAETRASRARRSRPRSWEAQLRYGSASHRARARPSHFLPFSTAPSPLRRRCCACRRLQARTQALRGSAWTQTRRTGRPCTRLRVLRSEGAPGGPSTRSVHSVCGMAARGFSNRGSRAPPVPISCRSGAQPPPQQQQQQQQYAAQQQQRQQQSRAPAPWEGYEQVPSVRSQKIRCHCGRERGSPVSAHSPLRTPPRGRARAS